MAGIWAVWNIQTQWVAKAERENYCTPQAVNERSWEKQKGINFAVY